MATAAFTAAGLAVAAQLYISPIPEVSTIKVLAAYSAVNCALLSYLLFLTPQASYVSTVVNQAFLPNLIFLFTAWSLTAIRRLYFSPISKLPGPKFAALSKLWEANEFRLGRASETHKKLHAQYGDIIRIGPNEVSINNVDAVAKIYKGKYTRGTFYEVGALDGAFNLNTTRDYKKHTVWRRIW
jgi:cytochrome P450 family 628